nr:hypothetical transcript [Hymenolepis microstoma]
MKIEVMQSRLLLYIVFRLHNGGLVVFNANFNCWREKIPNRESIKDERPKLPLQKPISQAVAKEREQMKPSSNSLNPLTEKDGSNDTTAHVEVVEQAEIKSSKLDVNKIKEDEAVPDISNKKKSP